MKLQNKDTQQLLLELQNFPDGSENPGEAGIEYSWNSLKTAAHKTAASLTGAYKTTKIDDTDDKLKVLLEERNKARVKQIELNEIEKSYAGRC